MIPLVNPKQMGLFGFVFATSASPRFFVIPYPDSSYAHFGVCQNGFVLQKSFNNRLSDY